ncbi:Uncharacterised protein g8949 [Pycnogonum litorale]
MPYLFVSTQIRLEEGPTIVGDEHVDVSIMEYLAAQKVTPLGNNSPQYKTKLAPRIILNKLEELGYIVISSVGIGQTCVWTLHKPLLKETDREEH